MFIWVNIAKSQQFDIILPNSKHWFILYHNLFFLKHCHPKLIPSIIITSLTFSKENF